MKIKRILVPMDFSKCAVKALRYAKKIALELDAELQLLTVTHIANVHAEVMGAGAIVQPMISEYEEQVNDKYAKLSEQENLEEVRYSVTTLTSGFIDAVAQCMEENRLDLIVTGTHEEHDILDFIFGSRSSDIIGHAKVPVLMIPQNAAEDSIKKIGLAIDFEDKNNFEKLEVVKYFAQINKAEIVVLHITDKNNKLFVFDDEKVALSGFLKGVDHTFFTLKNKGDLIESLIDSSKELNLDVLFMHPKNYGTLKGLFHKSKTKSMAMHIDIPLLTVHE